ncbi:hypothetical protein SAMN04488026_106234 [Aliiruegeria lutimaris]|uniref:Uncharacterized protein n=1 Tax=Aliiruegeria lutimaris TaxID=571298 RepID=A0A1G9GE23_9RHOB|nr:hypothetical protein SAMN04488026_106234 [Aliiruegeria lutimaris]
MRLKQATKGGPAMCVYPRQTICPPRSNDPFETGTVIFQPDFRFRTSGRYDHTWSFEAGADRVFGQRGSEKRPKVTRRTFLQGLVAVPVVATTIGFPVPENNEGPLRYPGGQLRPPRLNGDPPSNPALRYLWRKYGGKPPGWPHDKYRRDEKNQSAYPVDIAPSKGSCRSDQDAAECPGASHKSTAAVE